MQAPRMMEDIFILSTQSHRTTKAMSLGEKNADVQYQQPGCGLLHQPRQLDIEILTMTNGNVSRSGSLVMAIDLIYDALVLLQQDATVLYASISGASVTGNTPSTNIYSIPWDTQIKMTFTINDLVLALDESTLFVN